MIITKIQKRFADVDVLGHVNNVNLQHYFDVGKDDFFARKFGMRSHLPADGPGVITAATDTSYLAQTRWREPVEVETLVEKVGTKSFTFLQRLVNADTREVKARSRSVMVCFDFGAQRSVEIPAAWRAKFMDGRS